MIWTCAALLPAYCLISARVCFTIVAMFRYCVSRPDSFFEVG